MIICPRDGVELKEDNNYSYLCPHCDFYINLNSNNHVIFHPDINEDYGDYHASGLDNLYRSEQNHFWFKQRRNVIYSAFDRYVDKSRRVIEIGAGTGSISRWLLDKGYNISIGEIHKSGLEYARRYGIKERYQFDLLKTPFKNHFDAIGMFDVLEHIEDENKAIKNIYQMLTKKGLVLITVPAHMWLWNRDDAIAHHKRRYEVKAMKELFESNDFEVLEVRTFFISILPLLYLRTIINRDDGSNLRPEELTKEIRINPFINKVLTQITNIENKLFSRLNSTYGGSILLIARKKV